MQISELINGMESILSLFLRYVSQIHLHPNNYVQLKKSRLVNSKLIASYKSYSSATALWAIEIQFHSEQLLFVFLQSLKVVVTQ